jgi:hypothetical protein
MKIAFVQTKFMVLRSGVSIFMTEYSPLSSHEAGEFQLNPCPEESSGGQTAQLSFPPIAESAAPVLSNKQLLQWKLKMKHTLANKQSTFRKIHQFLDFHS